LTKAVVISLPYNYARTICEFPWSSPVIVLEPVVVTVFSKPEGIVKIIED
jgi:hypothetical protein